MLKLIPPIWGMIYLALAGALSAAFPWRTLIDLRLVWLGAILLMAGLALTASALLLFRREGTEINPTSESNKKLVVWGPYRLTRNPMYLGLVTLTSGIAFWSGDLPMFAVPLLLFATCNWAHIPFEEAKMRRQFGADYDRYMQRMRRWL